MTRLLAAFVVGAIMAGSSVSHAQVEPTRSVEEYLCLFGGDCKTPSKKKKRGFSLTRPRADLRLDFELGSAKLTPAAQREAKIFAQALLSPSLAAKRFRIEGHTDSSGDAAFNLRLSKRRAQAVVDYLSTQGVPPSRLEARGYGSRKPLPGRSAAAGENRRVEAVLM